MKLRRPLGLVLSGGGAHGAWQAGVVDALTSKHGLNFDPVIGISAGALTGAGYALNRMPELNRRWRAIDSAKILRFMPRMRPSSLFSNDSIYESIEFARDEERAKQNLRCRLTIVGVCRKDRVPVYAHFAPEPEAAWSPPLADWLVASCSIPGIFPPVDVELEGQPYTLIDGGCKTKRSLCFSDLNECQDVIVLDMKKPGTFGKGISDRLRRMRPGSLPASPTLFHGIAELRRIPKPPRIFLFYPTKPFEQSSLEFKESACVPWLEQGLEDADFLLENLEAYRV